MSPNFTGDQTRKLFSLTKSNLPTYLPDICTTTPPSPLPFNTPNRRPVAHSVDNSQQLRLSSLFHFTFTHFFTSCSVRAPVLMGPIIPSSYSTLSPDRIRVIRNNVPDTTPSAIAAAAAEAGEAYHSFDSRRRYCCVWCNPIPPSVRHYHPSVLPSST